MPSIEYYRVTQTREIKVAANNPTDAARIASAHLEDEELEEKLFGHVVSPVKITDLMITED